MGVPAAVAGETAAEAWAKRAVATVVARIGRACDRSTIVHRQEARPSAGRVGTVIVQQDNREQAFAM